MIFQHFLLDVNEVNLYVVGCEQTREAIIVDAGAFDTRVVDYVRDQNLSVKAVLLTHGHWDHVDGLEGYLEAFGCPVIGPNNLDAKPLDRKIGEGDTVEVGRLSFRAFWTTGHTPDSMSLYCESERICLSGDALFAGSIGGTADDDKKAEQVGHIREKIFALPPETLVYSGHGPATSVGVEKACNPFFN